MPTSNRIRGLRRLASTIALALLVLVGATSVLGVHLVVRGNDQLTHTWQVIERIEAAQSNLSATEAAGRGYRLTSHPALRKELDRLVPEVSRATRDLVAVTADNPQQQARAQELHDRAVSKAEEMVHLAELQEREGVEAAIRAMDPAGMVARMHDFNALAREMLVEELRLLEDRRMGTERRARLLLAIVLVGLAVSLATLWGLLASLSRENRLNRRLELETRGALQRLQRAQRQTERLSEQRHALSEYTGMLQSAQSVDEALELTVGTIERLLPHVAGHCYLARPSRDLVESRATFGEPAVASSETFRQDQCWALRRGRPHHDRSGSAAVRCSHIDRDAPRAGVAVLCLPLTAHGEVLGVLHASTRRAGQSEAGHANGANEAADGSDAQILSLLAEQLALAIANLRLHETLRQQSLRDPLTGLFNRRYLEEGLERERLRCARKGQPLALLMADVDHFKDFNDSHGHSAGDAVLAHMGRSLLAQVRADDLACRYGGEEFTIVMPETDVEAAIARAESIRRTVSRTTIEHNGRTLGPVTVSIGIAVFPADGATSELLFESADASLYRAKAEGRDRVVHGGALETT